MTYSGQIVDVETNEGVPGATVELWYNNLMLSRAAANGNGLFTIASASVPDQVRISSASYKTASYPFNEVSDDSFLAIEKNIPEGENVIVTASRKSMWKIALFGFGLLVLADKNNNR